MAERQWTHITNTFNMHVVWVAGATLYGEIFGLRDAGDADLDRQWRHLEATRASALAWRVQSRRRDS